ncbi:zinc finger protein 25-like [Sitodiplosis mosellana]|uniref:zinc finger protein 25-like n=1 Tax=Sitodiplosis mosellana TaxID=263140 RepID=UPI002443C001|nr:zinc finger protein 25-like [Sitodiplosis mosellana]
MCSRYAETQCCVCCRFLDQSSSRIIVEICGHQKCRECFIKEEDGCSICARNKGRECPSEIDRRSNGHESSFEVIPSSSESVKVLNAGRAGEAPFAGEINEDVSHIITMNENGDEVRYKCTICQKSFKSRNNRKYHVFCDKTRSKPFQCNQCDKQFITLAHMNYHQSTHNTDKQFACPHCQKIYSGPIALKKHMKKHQNDFKYQCSQCDEKFLYKEQLNIHQNRHNNVFHKCSECGKRFLVKSNLTKHIQSHSGLNRKVCPICKNSFSGNSALKTHMLTVHSKSKPYQCEKCSKKFIDQRTLERHWKTHLDNLFYECTLCSAKSGRKDNIRRHVRNLHSESDEELQLILDKIFDNFEKRKTNSIACSNVVREEKTEKSRAAMNTDQSVNVAACVQELNEVRKSVEEEPIKPLSVVRNIATSVIKFVGRSQDVSVQKGEEKSAKQAEIVDKPEPIQVEESLEVVHGQLSSTATEPDPIAEIGVNLPSLEPLNFDAFPNIAPLPLINTNTNLTVYRQLLSPYLKKQPDSSNASTNDDASMQPRRSPKKNYKPSSTPTMVIDRPPKKMIEKYEFYRR